MLQQEYLMSMSLVIVLLLVVLRSHDVSHCLCFEVITYLKHCLYVVINEFNTFAIIIRHQLDVNWEKSLSVVHHEEW